MTISKITPLEPTGIKLTRRSFLGWTAKLGIVAVTTKIIPVQSLDYLECLPCNITASDAIRREKIYIQEHFIRSELWNKALVEAVLDHFKGLYDEYV